MTDERAFALDRYIAATDRAIADGAALEELLAVFAPDAVVRIGPAPVRGSAALREMYGRLVASHAESRHFCTTTMLPDGRERTEWVCAARMADGSLVTMAGVEHAIVDADGRIVDLHNEFSRPPG
ncbi:nuclear transport factor 2 family protein [Pseudonocardia tropica]|uniref:Nuclear transport factor 2 family protein n=1 Tax=Pseudonocardia tropica TaxID=681289 RepID=A0ABV1K179_9PSEU